MKAFNKVLQGRLLQNIQACGESKENWLIGSEIWLSGSWKKSVGQAAPVEAKEWFIFWVKTSAQTVKGGSPVYRSERKG